MIKYVPLTDEQIVRIREWYSGCYFHNRLIDSEIMGILYAVLNQKE